jgi:hypothetical protein
MYKGSQYIVNNYKKKETKKLLPRFTTRLKYKKDSGTINLLERPGNTALLL